MEEAERKFKEFNWADSQGWRIYWDNLYPTPPLSKVDKFKRSWFKRNVDSNISSTPLSEVGKQTQQTTPNQYRSQGNFAILTLEAGVRLLYLLITAPLFVLPLIGVRLSRYIYYHYYIDIALLLIFLLSGIVRERGLPKMDSVWLASAFYSDMTQYIMYTCILMMSAPRPVYLILPFLTCLIGLNSLAETNLSKLPKWLENIVGEIFKYTKDNIYWLMQTRGDVECYLLFYIVFGFLTKSSAVITLMAYINFMKLRIGIGDPFIMSAFSKLHGCIVKLLSYDMFGHIPLRMYLKISELLTKYMSGPRPQY